MIEQYRLKHMHPCKDVREKKSLNLNALNMHVNGCICMKIHMSSACIGSRLDSTYTHIYSTEYLKCLCLDNGCTNIARLLVHIFAPNLFDGNSAWVLERLSTFIYFILEIHCLTMEIYSNIF